MQDPLDLPLDAANKIIIRGRDLLHVVLTSSASTAMYAILQGVEDYRREAAVQGQERRVRGHRHMATLHNIPVV